MNLAAEWTNMFAARLAPVFLPLRLLLLAGFVLFVSAGSASASSTNTSSAEEPVDARLAAVYFALGDGTDVGSGPLSAAGANRPAAYRSFTVLSGGESKRLFPLGGTTSVRLSSEHASAVAVQSGSDLIDSTDSDFGDALAGAIGSTRVERFARIATGASNKAVSIDLAFDQPVGPGDFLLLQESGGDAAVYLTPLDSGGTVVGPTVAFDGVYQWNMGRSDIDDVPLWASVVPAPVTEAGEAPAAVRLTTTKAELKVVALVSSEPTPLTEDTTASSGTGALKAAALAEASSAGGTPLSEDTEAPPVGPDPVLTEADVSTSSGSQTLAADLGTEATATSDGSAAQPAAGAETPEALAMTGVPTEPWILVALAMGFIFFGWTTALAFRSGVQNMSGANSGHKNLDFLGFD